MIISDPEDWKSLDRVYMKQRIKFVREFAVGTTILDIGCGHGYIADKVHWLNYTGWDINAGVIAQNKIEHPGVKFLIQDYTMAPPQKFDTVIAIDLMEHLKDPKQFILDISKFANKRVIIQTPVMDRIPHPEHLHSFTSVALREILNEIVTNQCYEIYLIGKDTLLRRNRYLNALSGRVIKLLGINEDKLLQTDSEEEAVAFGIVIYIDGDKS